MTEIIISAVALVLIVVASAVAYKTGYSSRKRKEEAEIGSAKSEALRIVEEAKKEGESKKREAILAAKEENHKERQELEKEIKDRRSEISRQEHRIQQKEENLDKKNEALEKREEALLKKDKELDVIREELSKIKDKELEMLQNLSGLSKEEAKQYLLEKLEAEVKVFDPFIALDGGEDGLIFYRKIVAQSVNCIKKGGSLLFEIGYDQGEDVKQLMEEAGFADVTVKKDFAGLDRVVFGVYNR